MAATTQFKFDFTLDPSDVDPDFAIPEQLARVRLSSPSPPPTSKSEPEAEAHPKPTWEHQQRVVELGVEELVSRPSLFPLTPLDTAIMMIPGSNTNTNTRQSQAQLDRLPDTGAISYSPLPIPVLGPHPGRSTAPLTLARRDLFDARFQLIAHSDATETEGERAHEQGRDRDRETGLAFIEAPSDLVPGVYEGGLKTWEGSVDLAGYLAGHVDVLGDVRGKRILEIGCGTAIPSMSILHRVFSSDPPELDTPGQETELHLQDYNASVLSLVSLPNLLLTWYMSPAAAPFRTTAPSLSQPASTSHTSTTAPPPADPSIPGELPLTPLLKAAFLKALERYRVRIRLFAGPWGAFLGDDDEGVSVGSGEGEGKDGRGRYDVVLSAETVYRVESMGALLRLMRGAAGAGAGMVVRAGGEGDGGGEDERRVGGEERGAEGKEHVCLVAAKVLYFGVGGGVAEFVEGVNGKGGSVETVWEGGVGVGRRVMRVRW
ncbi:putative protein-histidine N-methyltransferase activity [Lyophyllum shimeji]|uniref:protein-histidine N-methyltransferase n=1 Tax=Lyophyllum shimeji TaxID=47721 RepID=A0A9P3PPU4_LYOSH|nr:putative protein-histidine N-methyltransferase activity [Lyophyllum shimeji]